MRLTILVFLIRCQLRHWSLPPAGSGARMLLRRAPSATRRSGSIWLRLRNRHCAFFSLPPVPPVLGDTRCFFPFLCQLLCFASTMAARLPLARLSGQRLTTLTRATRAPIQLRGVQGLSTLSRSNVFPRASGLLRVSSGYDCAHRWSRAQWLIPNDSINVSRNLAPFVGSQIRTYGICDQDPFYTFIEANHGIL